VEKVNISNVPQPFREFLEGGNDAEISAMGIDANKKDSHNVQKQKDVQDFMFLAAILMMCDE